MTAARLSWAQVLRWRLDRHGLAPVRDTDPVELAGRLGGVQAQVPSAAVQALGVRRPEPVGVRVAAALAEGRLVRTWAARGTLHLLPVATAARQLALLAAARSWHRSSWQKEFAALHVMEALTERVALALEDGPLTREELVAVVEADLHHDGLADLLRSGWSTVLKPLAWQGVLCQGPPQGRSVTFARPDAVLAGWSGLPDPDEAGPVVVREHLAVTGPASPAAFDAWLLRGGTPKRVLRGWFAALGDELVDVEVEGRPGLVLARDLDALAATAPEPELVHLLPGFDQFVLLPGTADAAVVPAEHRSEVSRTGGWIAPVVLLGGRVAGTWTAADGTPVVAPFPGVRLPEGPLAAAVERAAAVLADGPAPSPA